MKLLESKVAIITGGSRGIGKSICETLLKMDVMLLLRIIILKILPKH